MSKYTTKELIEELKMGRSISLGLGASPQVEVWDAIIAKLRAADKLCDAAKSPAFRDGVIFCEGNPQMKRLRKAIAEYEGENK